MTPGDTTGSNAGRAADAPSASVAGAAHEWVSFEDDDGATWLFDVTFLTSNWRCTFGTTCRGTEPDDNGARGCCAHGAHLVDETERRYIGELAATLDESLWENRPLITSDDDLFTTIDGDLATTRVDDACVFLNSPGFVGGHGCALHLAALAADIDPIRYKPTVCWQLPFRLEHHVEDAGTQVTTLRAWRRSDWGEGGRHFGWWCTEELDAAGPDEETWRSHGAELRELVGDWPYEQLRAWLERRNETTVSISGPGGSG